MKRKLRILVAKAGLDGHDRGAKVVARALADAGYEVIYSGLHQTPEMIAAAALQESVDAVGLSMMSGAHMTHFPAVLDGAARRAGASDVVLFGGGIVPDEDAAALKALGVAAIFTPGTSTQADRRLDRARAAAARRGSGGVTRGAGLRLGGRGGAGRCRAAAGARQRAGPRPRRRASPTSCSRRWSKHGGDVNRCFEKALADTLDVAGKIELAVDVGDGGQVTKAAPAQRRA